MKEGFYDLATISAQTAAYADLELQSYLSSLSPAQQASFLSGQVNGAISTVQSEKQNTYKSAASTLEGLDQNIASAMYYLARTQDLTNIASNIDTLAQKQLSTIDQNQDVSIRQHEINEWSNSNKLDTLYFLQVLFVTLSFIGVLLFLKVSGLISGYLFSLLTRLSAIVLIIVLIFRYRYTAVARDTRYWSKTKFPKQPDVIGNASSVNVCPPATGS